jgi:hypothetical protein
MQVWSLYPPEKRRRGQHAAAATAMVDDSKLSGTKHKMRNGNDETQKISIKV